MKKNSLGSNGRDTYDTNGTSGQERTMIYLRAGNPRHQSAVKSAMPVAHLQPRSSTSRKRWRPLAMTANSPPPESSPAPYPERISAVVPTGHVLTNNLRGAYETCSEEFEECLKLGTKTELSGRVQIRLCGVNFSHVCLRFLRRVPALTCHD